MDSNYGNWQVIPTSAKSKELKQISNAPGFIFNSEVHQHIQINTVEEEISTKCKIYKTRLDHHANDLLNN